MRRAVARGRVFPQYFSTDRRYGHLSLKACALFPLMWANADDQGRLTGDPEEIKYAACPNIDHITKADVPELLEELGKNQLIKVYTTSKTQAIQLLDWWEVAKLQWARPSEYDPPDGWEDRLRYKERPEGPVITQNWTPKDKIRNTLSQEMKKAILERDNYTCRYCGKGINDGIEVEVAHIIPVRDGGANDDENLVAACHKCNMQELGVPPGLSPSQSPSQSGGQHQQRESSRENPEIEIGKEIEIGEGKRNIPGQPPDRPGDPSPSPAGLLTDELEILQRLTEYFKREWGRVPAREPDKIIPREPTARESAQLRDLARELSAAGGCEFKTIEEAFRDVAGRPDKMHVSYVGAILREWLGAARGPPA